MLPISLNTCVLFLMIIGFESIIIKYLEGLEKKNINLQELSLLVEFTKLFISAPIYNFSKKCQVSLNPSSSCLSIFIMTIPKIPCIALLSWLFISNKISPTVLFSILFICFICHTTSFKFTSLAIDASTFGFIGILMCSGLSGSAIFFLSLVTRIKAQEEDVVLQNVKFIMCNAIIIALKWQIPSYQPDWIYSLTFIFLAFNCLLALITVKYCDGITKAVPIILLLGSLFIWRALYIGIPWNFYVTATFYAVALNSSTPETPPSKVNMSGLLENAFNRNI